MLRIIQESEICWLRAGMTSIRVSNSTIPRAVFIWVLIYSIVLLSFPTAHANEDWKIRRVFDNVAKYIKVDEKCKDFDVIEKKSDKFNIKVAQNSGKHFSIHSILKKAKDSFESGDNKAAISFLNQVTAKFPYHKNALIGLGNIYYANKEYEKAIEIYTRLLKEYPSNSYILEDFLTIISQYNPDLALSEMLKLYDIHKNCAPLLANLGLTYIKKKDYAKAKEYMIAATSLDQNNIFYVYNLAVILDKLSDFKNAAIFYLKLLNMAVNSKSISEEVPIRQVEARLKFIKLYRYT
ncbi:tetratricopeptide repeat protein [Wolbachia endosymbiont of Mansonella ozzardi]|uniref:tetratricopeptide repeat protein n=1 Tax=Wolbachia endosymbiont of Mansonella ozzardi TaxID=137464 RepID=UPI001CE0FF78|nr:tetratricopeptide repeat protein [Wolbachia endosymbiont of Mansonella ozzardi]MCA4774827.1 tetratricopeptide repeat protein [Wolbachia endosymbiont of Mansonella ozzardi]